jgi:hypothetical protein
VSAARRTAPCSRTDGTNRLQQARTFLEVAELVLGQDDELATPQVAAALAVLSGIASADAACCSRLGMRSRGQDHKEALSLLTDVEPDGRDMARDLRRLLDMKDSAHYATIMVKQSRAESAVSWARRLYDLASNHVR